MTTTNETKRNVPAIEAAINDVTGVLVLTFSNGRDITVKADELAVGIQRYAMLHGLKQKLVDAAAITRNPDTGRSATIEDKFEAVKEVYDRLLAGQWNKARGDGTGSGGLLFKALCRVYPTKTPDAIREFLAKKSDAEKTALRGNPKIAEAIAAIRAEAGTTANIDTDGLLDELAGDAE